MQQPRFYKFLHRQVPVLTLLSLFAGLGYILLAWLHGFPKPVAIWYGLILTISAWGYLLHQRFTPTRMSREALFSWYRQLTLFFYSFFALWTTIFVIYVREDIYQLHYVAIFTQIGAATVASALLNSNPRLYQPTIPLMIAPLMVYFFTIGEWYGYLLTVFAGVFGAILLYAANSSNRLLNKTHYQATHDQLTGLHNRHFFMDHLQQTLNTLREAENYSYIMLIDLDHFKTVNDLLGHDVGDALLQEIAERLKEPLPKTHHLSRLGGDEFVIVGSDVHNEEQCIQQAIYLGNQLLARLKETYIINNHHIYISASIGIRLIAPGDYKTSQLIREADIAMYEVKSSGRDGLFLFDKNVSRRVQFHLETERLLHFALQEREIELYYQPQHDASKRVVGVETLVRWNSSKLGYTSPADFIPIAEQTGLIIELGNYILDSALSTFRNWHNKGINLEQFSINVSIRQIIDREFIKTVKRLMDAHLTDELRKKIIFEITETVAAEEIGWVIKIMKELNALGIRFSMDDFGTGYSSLSYLKQLPIHEIKIDQAFVLELETSQDDQAMVTTILNMAKIFGFSVVAEGVESTEQFEILKSHQCQIFQGYYFSRPLSKANFEDYYLYNRAQSAA